MKDLDILLMLPPWHNGEVHDFAEFFFQSLSYFLYLSCTKVLLYILHVSKEPVEPYNMKSKQVK